MSWEKQATTTIRLCAGSGLDGNLYEFELDPRDLFTALERDRLFAVS